MIKGAYVNKGIVLLIGAILLLAGLLYASDEYAGSAKSEFGRKTVDTVTDTTKSAVSGTEKIATTSVSDTIAMPGTAIQAIKNTANTALKGTDAAMKTLTGEDKQ